MHTHPSKAAALRKQKHVRCRCLLPGIRVRSCCSAPSPEAWHCRSLSRPSLTCPIELPTSATFTPSQQTSCSMCSLSNSRMTLNTMPFFQLQCEMIWQIPPTHFISACFIRVKYKVGDILSLQAPFSFLLMNTTRFIPSAHICQESRSF